MVTGNRFVEGKGLHAVSGRLLDVIKIGVENTRARPVETRRHVVASRRILLRVFWHCANLYSRFRHPIEVWRDGFSGIDNHLVIVSDHLIFSVWRVRKRN